MVETEEKVLHWDINKQRKENKTHKSSDRP
jgi:hypothetical protein